MHGSSPFSLYKQAIFVDFFSLTPLRLRKEKSMIIEPRLAHSVEDNLFFVFFRDYLFLKISAEVWLVHFDRLSINCYYWSIFPILLLFSVQKSDSLWEWWIMQKAVKNLEKNLSFAKNLKYAKLGPFAVLNLFKLWCKTLSALRKNAKLPVARKLRQKGLKKVWPVRGSNPRHSRY